MGAVRLHFKRGRDDWEYGYLTIMIWLNGGLMEAYEKGTDKPVEYEDPEDLLNLHRQLLQGEATLNYSQTLYFIQATDLLSRMLVDTDKTDNFLVFSIASQLTKRFINLKEFEDYYLDYSSSVLEVIRREFEKEPELKGALANLLKL